MPPSNALPWSYFWSKVVRGSGCWEWQAARQGGYGVWRSRKAHRVAWVAAHGPIPEGLFVCHRCDNPGCVRPDHLFLGTAADNQADAARKSRMPHGERHKRAKLTAEQVLEIRAAYPRESGPALAARYGVSSTLIYCALQGRIWRRVTGGAPIPREVPWAWKRARRAHRPRRSHLPRAVA